MTDEIVTIVFLAVSLVYAAMIVAIFFGFRRISRQTHHSNAKLAVSILLPFRNEESGIAATLQSILNQQTEADFEVIAIDDHSTDDSARLVADIATRNPRLRLIANDGQGKKAALATGIAAARHNAIITTDADCHYPARWLDAMTATFEQSGADLLAAPVVLSPASSWFQKFQFVDFASLVGSGIGAAGCGHPIMCNGANLMFSQLTYNKLSDPTNTRFASGDDVFLLHSMKAANAKIVFTAQPETIATTRPAPTIGAFLQQRLRWGGKATGYTDKASIGVAALVALTSAALCAGAALLPWSALPLVCVFVPKLAADTLLLLAVSKQFGNRSLLWWMPVYEIVVAVYTVYVAVAAVLGIGRKGWKNVT